MGKYTKLEEKIASIDNKQANLIKILQYAQEQHSYLSRETIEKISEFTKLPPTQLMGVITFYAQFKLNPVGKHLIKVCEGTACHVNGAKAIKAAVLKHLNISENEVTKDKYYSIEGVACLGCCSLSPVLMIDDQTFGNLKPESIKSVLDDFKAKN